MQLKGIREQFESCISSFSQRFGYVKTSARNLITSSGKIAKVALKKNIDDEMTLKNYENDKKVFENYMNALEEVISQAKEKLEKSKTKTAHQNGTKSKG